MTTLFKIDYGLHRNPGTDFGVNFKPNLEYEIPDEYKLEKSITISIEQTTVELDDIETPLAISYEFSYISEAHIYYSINDSEFIGLEIGNELVVVSDSEDSYDFDFSLISDIALKDDDIIKIRFKDVEDDIDWPIDQIKWSNEIEIEIASNIIQITNPLNGDLDLSNVSMFEIEYDWNDVEVVEVYYNINNSESWILKDTIDISTPSSGSGVYEFGLVGIDLNHSDILKVKFKESDSNASSTKTYTIQLTYIEIDDVDILELTPFFEQDEDYFYD